MTLHGKEVKVEDLVAALEDILDECDGREDVEDGSDGTPRPNSHMRIAIVARRALNEGE